MRRMLETVRCECFKTLSGIFNNYEPSLFTTLQSKLRHFYRFLTLIGEFIMIVFKYSDAIIIGIPKSPVQQCSLPRCCRYSLLLHVHLLALQTNVDHYFWCFHACPEYTSHLATSATIPPPIHHNVNNNIFTSSGGSSRMDLRPKLPISVEPQNQQH